MTVLHLQQIKSHMKEIESTRSQIQLSDLPEFDDRIKSIQDEVLAGVSSFREVQQMYAREKQDKEPKRMPFAKTRNTGKIIINDCWSSCYYSEERPAVAT